MSSKIEFTRPDGKTAPGYYIEPDAGAKAPGLVVIQEWWGLNEQIKRVGEKWAAQGYRVLIPDLYRGELALDEKEAEHHLNDLDFGDAATQDIRGAVQYLKQQSDKVGITGYCMGGVLTVIAAMHVPEADAAVSWYGVPPDEAGDPGKIQIPIQCHFALQDSFFPIAQADALEEKLKAGNVEHECYRYDAEHAFANEDWKFYDAGCAEKAWERSVAFLDRHMKH